MGTKRHLASRVRDLTARVGGVSEVVDLFGGMGSVGAVMCSESSVLINDAQSFTAPVNRSRFKLGARPDPSTVAAGLKPKFEKALASLAEEFADVLDKERKAFSKGRQELQGFMASAPHVGINAEWARRAVAARDAKGTDHYKLTVLYFGGGYFSFRQAIEVDALRAAIDDRASSPYYDWLICALLATCSTLVNSPGHAAQYLKPTSDSMYLRIKRQMHRPVWPVFTAHLEAIRPLGTKSWRKNNRVCVGDALALVSSGDLRDQSLIYADPPYSRGQYSRYYHLYETLYRYDFPESTGLGRYRSDRFKSPFGLKGHVTRAFETLLDSVARRGFPLIVSYPTDGLLQDAGACLTDLLNQRFASVEVEEFPFMHSTMGSDDQPKKRTTERMFVCA